MVWFAERYFSPVILAIANRIHEKPIELSHPWWDTVFIWWALNKSNGCWMFVALKKAATGFYAFIVFAHFLFRFFIHNRNGPKTDCIKMDTFILSYNQIFYSCCPLFNFPFNPIQMKWNYLFTIAIANKLYVFVACACERWRPLLIHHSLKLIAK